ncbi:hypothetical protein LL972_18330 [Xanthomonas campestris pv. asclepiadis]|uniref:hypothetical protein n=1 Tax=Xanthomonas campestris TaxID=339 RepID=UPI001E2EACA2|nr:hypothetical protein [Xanthomonas campestris]MCC4617931.1 hypothetical protein [Xanthomonas campestris pv. asclepiadis]
MLDSGRTRSYRCVCEAIDVRSYAARLPRWHPVRGVAATLQALACIGDRAIPWLECTDLDTAHAIAPTAKNIRSQLLPRNIRRVQSATAVMPMMDYSGMNTTELKHATQLL